MSHSVLSAKLKCKLGPSASQHFRHKSSVVIALLQFSLGTIMRLLSKALLFSCQCILFQTTDVVSLFLPTFSAAEAAWLLLPVLFDAS